MKKILSSFLLLVCISCTCTNDSLERGLLRVSCPAEAPRGSFNVDVTVTNVFDARFYVENWWGAGPTASANFECRLTRITNNRFYSEDGKVERLEFSLPTRGLTSVRYSYDKVWKPGESKTLSCGYILDAPPGTYELDVRLRHTKIWSPKKVIKVLPKEIDYKELYRK